MATSVLVSIKKMLGIEADDSSFDTDLIIHINSALMTANQLGVGPTDTFSIVTDAETWEDFLGEVTTLEAIKSYIYLKVRLVFDPPSNSFLVEALRKSAEEMEWRLAAISDAATLPPPVVEEE